MDYPIWITPAVSKGFLMAMVAVVHVFVAQFAVGGGIYIVWMERRARKWGSEPILGWLQRHTFFFLLLTMVFGGLTGVGIWFTMGVANPAATSALIHTFLWLWAAEWVFFLVEVVSLIVYYYSYPMSRDGRMAPKTHLWIGYVYAIAAYLSLVLINGIICFMLTPGEALESGSLWEAFFNPTTFPSLLFRSSLCLILAGMFGMFTASRIKEAAAKHKVIRESSLWICLPFLGLLAGSAWYYLALPPERQAAILRRTADIHPFLLAYGWVLPVIFILGIIAFVRAEKLRRPLTVLILGTGLVLVGSFEWMRESGRRPWIIPGYMYSSSVRPDEGKFVAEHGIAAASGWLRMYDAEHKDDGDYLVKRGKIIFAQQCGTCHAIGGPGLSIPSRLSALAHGGIFAQISGQGGAVTYMPPFYGNEGDLEALSTYLFTIRDKAEE